MASTIQTRAPKADQPSADQLSGLARHLIRATDNEKARLARELHDELGSNLTAVNLDVAAVEDKIKALDPALAVRLRRALESLRTVVGLSRRIIEELRPSALDNMDLVDALRGHCEEFTEATGLECAADLSPDPVQTDRDRSIALFSVARTTMENAARHANASRLELSMSRKQGGLHLRVCDNGVGVPADVFERPANGLLEARERIAMVGGTFAIGRGQDGRGTVVEVFVPD